MLCSSGLGDRSLLLPGVTVPLINDAQLLFTVRYLEKRTESPLLGS